MIEITSKTTAFGQEVYFVGGFSVSEKVYIAAQELEKENAELSTQIENISKLLNSQKGKLNRVDDECNKYLDRLQESHKEVAELKEAYEHLCDIHLAATQPIFLGEAIKEMEKTAKTNKLFIAKKNEELGGGE
tara:strand:+ start:12583 stop:12981 length:399 start_codon:yes stop_codon:yes gene_type:complete